MCNVNFVTEFNAFMDFAKVHSLSAQERLLWIALFKIMNDRAVYCRKTNSFEWATGFVSISNAEVELMSSLNRKNIESVRNSLRELGLIEFVPGKKSTPPQYRMKYLSLRDDDGEENGGEMPSVSGHYSGDDSVHNEDTIPDTILPHNINIDKETETEREKDTECESKPNPDQTGYDDMDDDVFFREQTSGREWIVADGQGGEIDMTPTMNCLLDEGYDRSELEAKFRQQRAFFADNPARKRRTYAMAAHYIRSSVADGLMTEQQRREEELMWAAGGGAP